MGEMLPANGCDGDLGEGFTIKDVPVENLRPLRVVVVGAGFSGILAAIRIPERLRNVELVVYEKNEGVGGVWYAFPESLLKSQS
jgi:NADPH-dependent 2,4-dienoyl-CoA reductase/sulfur reductase-like enzyme